MAYSDERRVTKRMGGRFSDITLGFVVVTIPMLLFAGLLLGLVFSYRVTHNDIPFENLQLAGTRDEPGVYYVHLNSTFLVFVASWSSSVAPMLASFVLILAAYPICRNYLRQARADKTHALLTPYQLALTLGFMNGGGFGALWNWLKYLAGWKTVREKQGRVLSSTASVAILASVMALAVFGADTWLHVATKTVNFIQVSAVTAADYSLILNPGCTVANNSFVAQRESFCSLNPSASTIFLANATQSVQVLNNVSDIMTVYTYESTPPYTYLGVPPSNERFSRDYTATTFGMTTQCKPVSTQCKLNGDVGAFTPFKCADSFQGDLTRGRSFQTAYFTDSAMTSNSTAQGILNPYYFGLATREVDGTLGGLGTNPAEIITPSHGGIAFVLFCTVTLHDVEYDSVNGTITRFVAKQSNSSVANVWQGPNAFGSASIGQPGLQRASLTSIFRDTAQEAADEIALAYSRVALAIGAQAVRQAPALAVQERESFLVSRVPAAPLYTLVIANLLFVLLGIILTAIAMSTSSGEIREVQARLSILGLVADRFEAQRGRDGVENMDEHFEEKDGNDSMRVAIDRGSGGGYTFKIWPKSSRLIGREEW